MAGARTGRLGSRWVRIASRGGRELHHRVSLGPDPGGVPVVLAHGMVSGLYLVPLAEFLAPRMRAYAPDLPGYGESWRPEKPLDVNELARVLGDWLDAIGLGRIHLVGNSLGCNVAVELAIARPGLVESLVLQGLTLAPELRSPARALPRWLVNSWREVPRGPLMRQAQRQVGAPQLIKGGLNLLRHRLEDRLPSISCPTLVIRGARDPMFPSAWADAAVRLLPRGRLCAIPGGTHTLNVVNPLALARAILSFVGAEGSSGDRDGAGPRASSPQGAPA